MKAQIVTTITTLVDISTFDTEHTVDITCEDELPRQMILAAVEGGVKSTLRTLQKGKVAVVEEDYEDS